MATVMPDMLRRILSAEGGIDRPYRVECDMMKRAVEIGIAIYHRQSGDDREYLKNRARLKGRLR
jgi:hypothetical protein